MLVLTRRPGESLILDDGKRQVRLTVVKVQGLNVRIGFDAPREIEIHRKELYEQMRREREDDESSSS